MRNGNKGKGDTKFRTKEMEQKAGHYINLAG